MGSLRGKDDKFRELAENRVNKAIKMVELIGNLSSTRNYSYSEEEVKKIFRHLEGSVAKAKSKFTEQLAKKKADKFKL